MLISSTKIASVLLRKTPQMGLSPPLLKSPQFCDFFSVMASLSQDAMRIWLACKSGHRQVTPPLPLRRVSTITSCSGLLKVFIQDIKMSNVFIFCMLLQCMHFIVEHIYALFRTLCKLSWSLYKINVYFTILDIKTCSRKKLAISKLEHIMISGSH